MAPMLLLLLLLLLASASSATPEQKYCTRGLRQHIKWGVATSAYQVEGGSSLGKRSRSVWDTFSSIADGSRGDVAVDMYHAYPEDVRLMQRMGIAHYRLSMSWSRILPQARCGTPVSPDGVQYYSKLLSTLRAHGITPYVTIFHWDLPQVLQDAYGGPMSAEYFARDFECYARTLFQLFGGTVRHWITFNEPWVTCVLQYNLGTFAPGIPHPGEAARYRCGHNILKAHALAVQAYRQTMQGGQIGIALDVEWAEPLDTGSASDASAAQLKLDAKLGWFADPIFLGRYPASVAQFAPKLTSHEAALINGSADFLGINHYTTRYVTACLHNNCSGRGYLDLTTDRHGAAIGPGSASAWLKVVPWGMRKVLGYAHRRYQGPTIMITENGVSTRGDDASPLTDQVRIDYYSSYIGSLCEAVALDQVKVAAYFAWSFVRNWEWTRGFTEDFGIVYVNTTTMKREVKASERTFSVGTIHNIKASLTPDGTIHFEGKPYAHPSAFAVAVTRKFRNSTRLSANGWLETSITDCFHAPTKLASIRQWYKDNVVKNLPPQALPQYRDQFAQPPVAAAAPPPPAAAAAAAAPIQQQQLWVNNNAGYCPRPPPAAAAPIQQQQQQQQQLGVNNNAGYCPRPPPAAAAAPIQQQQQQQQQLRVNNNAGYCPRPPPFQQQQQHYRQQPPQQQRTTRSFF
ncbi:hypothetical protein OEZ85_011038 [Tetradesmus obliquus]|uniref:Beta-glucosidase n=1 Tax=Tetradesmus obliquus TaxID=3088 RepID=A0ABY8TPE7_TETOB|nr:hypothetical protein OEZ85_011038 [Tetradesmus obliquus]